MTLYINHRKAKVLMGGGKIKYESSKVKSLKAITNLKEIATSTTHKWSIVHGKKM